MRIIFVRHGHPDYANDCLTDLGKRQAEACAKRLTEEHIDEFYSSGRGRAYETANFTAVKFGKEVTKLPFMDEIAWGGEGIPGYGDPWNMALAARIKEGLNPYENAWKDTVYYKTNPFMKDRIRIADGLDEFIEKLGYKRENDHYRVLYKNNGTIALFSHQGSSTMAFAHIFNIPIPIAYTMFLPDLTSISYVDFNGDEGNLIFPYMAMFNDCKHLRNI